MREYPDMSPAGPLVSVIMPVRNGMPYLAEAIESILRQTWQNLELLVINDHSTDGTAAYLTTLTDFRIKVLDNSGSGMSDAVTTGHGTAQGAFLARMDADDVSFPKRIEAQVRFLMSNPDVVGVGTQVCFLVNNAKTSALSYPCNSERIRSLLGEGRVVLCDSSMMLRADVARWVREKVTGPGRDFDFCSAWPRTAGLPI